MDDKKIFAILKAVEVGSLSKAASELGYTQSGLTQMMNSVEDELGCAILTRGYNGVQLTPNGEQLIPFLEDAASSLTRLSDAAQQLAIGTQKPIRIGTYPSISKSWLPGILKAYQKEFPDRGFEICVGNEDIYKMLDNDEIDLVLGEESKKGTYNWIPLIDDNYYAIVSKNSELGHLSSISIAELVKHDFIMSQISDLKSLVKPYLKEKKDRVQINSADDTSIISLIEQGLGVSILPQTSLNSISDNIQILNIEPPLKRCMGIILPRTSRKYVVDFVDFVVKNNKR